LLVAIFVVRGIAIQCLYPPLEGPDEYQHIAVIHSMVENRALPVYGQSKVPVSLYNDIVANPHPNHSKEQTGRIGAHSYETFYGSEPVVTPTKPINLYQAQHPPLYYLMMAPLYSWSRSVFDFRTTVYLLRCINIVAAAFALVLLLAPLRRMLADNGLCRLFCLAIAASPMFMVYVSRVANDAFALLFAGVALVLVLGISGARHARLSAGLVGFCIGLAVLCKLNGLVMLPVVFIYLMICAATEKITWRACARFSILITIGYLLVSLPYHVWVYAHHGTFLFDQVTSRYQELGFTMVDVLGGMRFSHLNDFLAKSICLDNLWTSGWSFLGLPRFLKWVYGVLLLVAATGSFFWIGARSRSENAGIIHDWYSLVVCILLAVMTTCALYLFALKHVVAYNFLSTPSYYFMIAYPAFLSCLFIAAIGYGRRIAGALALVLLTIFTFAELYGLCFVAVPYWSQTQGWSQMLARLASLHPVFPSPAFFPALYFLALMLLAIGVLISLQRRAE